jgi:hypothetical protein
MVQTTFSNSYLLKDLPISVVKQRYDNLLRVAEIYSWVLSNNNTFFFFGNENKRKKTSFIYDL